jgi:hypothetical protein
MLTSHSTLSRLSIPHSPPRSPRPSLALSSIAAPTTASAFLQASLSKMPRSNFLAPSAPCPEAFPIKANDYTESGMPSRSSKNLMAAKCTRCRLFVQVAPTAFVNRSRLHGIDSGRSGGRRRFQPQDTSASAEIGERGYGGGWRTSIDNSGAVGGSRYCFCKKIAGAALVADKIESQDNRRIVLPKNHLCLQSHCSRGTRRLCVRFGP